MGKGPNLVSSSFGILGSLFCQLGGGDLTGIELLGVAEILDGYGIVVLRKVTGRRFWKFWVAHCL